MYDQVLSWLVEHSLKHNYCTLLTRLCALHPDLLERARFPDKHLLVLHSFLFALKSRGPLPSLLNPMFVTTLLDGLVKFVMFDNRYGGGGYRGYRGFYKFVDFYSNKYTYPM